MYVSAEPLVPYVSLLYDWALATSSRKTYKTGVNHMKKFLKVYPRIPEAPFESDPPNFGILTLCFFAAFLLLKKSIKAAGTIKCYVAHVKNRWIRLGCNPKYLKSHILTRVLKGISRVRPRKRDTRPAFLLPSYRIPLHFRHPISGSRCAQIAAAIFSFFGMLRFHVLQNLSVKSLVLVDHGGVDHKMAALTPHVQKQLLFGPKVMGFYFDISDKFHPVARAYYPKLADTNSRWTSICPLRALKLLWIYGLLQASPFKKARLTEKILIETMQTIDKNDRDFKTHSLRIGAHTFFVTYGLPEDFVDFLSRRQTDRASLRYYRASARLTLNKLRKFMKHTDFS